VAGLMSEQEAPRDLVRTGGLMRCCLASINELYGNDPDHRASGGDVLGCRWCSSTMTFRDGAWEWNRP
jgi:hypothetical protein